MVWERACVGFAIAFGCQWRGVWRIGARVYVAERGIGLWMVRRRTEAGMETEADRFFFLCLIEIGID